MNGELKVTIKFLADVLFAKGIITSIEYEAINDIKSYSDLDDFTDNILGR